MIAIKHKLSLLAIFIISFIYLGHRIYYADVDNPKKLIVTDWDALGYYMYLPATLIYHDYKKLDWIDRIDKEYPVTGGELYQALKHENGNYYFKYLGGIAILQLPFFTAAHIYAKVSGHYKADGFSPPYQYAIAFGNLLYFIVALFYLRKFLLLFFEDRVVMVSLFFLTLATNLIQYIAINGGMSHGYIFPLYVAILWATYHWHQKPRWYWAAAIGYIIGLATISRPTEAVMLFIPLLWNTHTKEASKAKWKLVKNHLPQLVVTVLFGLIGILPQLLYWKSVTGSFVYDVGSKWTFLNPFFRVLFGWEKGWFIYTPITILFIIGFFFLKRYPFKNAVIWFGILNIYIIISWFDWRYGGSYSTRALTQSYPIYTLSLAAFLQYCSGYKWRWAVYGVGVYLIGVNLFQVYQYNRNILHYNDMNRQYYQAIYLNANPTPLQMSLLDTKDFLYDSEKYSHKTIYNNTVSKEVVGQKDTPYLIFESTNETINPQTQWLKVTLQLTVHSNSWKGVIQTNYCNQEHSFRLENALTKAQQPNIYSFYLKKTTDTCNHLSIFLNAPSPLSATIHQLKIEALKN